MREHTRRRLLAAMGTATVGSLAGCSALPFGNDPSVTGEELASIVSDPPPSISASLPVTIGENYLAAAEAGIREDLDAVPAPLDANAIPNGAIRDRLNRGREQAIDALERTAEAQTPWERADRLRRARSSVGYVVGGWAAIDGDRSVPDVQADAESLREELAEFRRIWAYVGTDPIDAVVVHDAIAGLVRGCVVNLNRVLSRDPSDATAALTVAETDESLTSAQGALRDAEHLFDRLRRGDAVRNHRATLKSAAATLTERVHTRRQALGLDGESSISERSDAETPAARALRDLRQGAYRSARLEERRAEEAFPWAIVEAHEELALLGAIETLQARVDAGEAVDPTSADDVRTIRRRALEAIETAFSEGDHRTLDRRRLHELVGAIEYYDNDLARYDADRQVSLSRLDWELAEYVLVEANARNVNRASAAVVAAITDAKM